METTIVSKRCSKCKQVYPATLEFFQSNKGRKDGFHSWCKICKQADQKTRGNKYYIDHREYLLQKAKDYAKANPEKQKARHHKWYKNNKALSNQRVNDNARKVRKLVLDHYGNQCECCGETQYEFLVIDHINGGGRKHRRSIPGGMVYRWLVRNNFPDGFRVLCHNCNMSLGFYGYCPHQIS